MTNLSEFVELFNKIQNCTVAEFKSSLTFVFEHYKDDTVLWKIFNKLLAYKKATFPPKVTLFITKLFQRIYYEEGAESLFSDINYLYQFISSKSVNARRHSLKIINIIVENNPDELLDIELMDKICERLFDKEKSVRREAIKICLKYQARQIQENTDVPDLLKDVMRYDTSKDLRRLVFENIELNELTQNAILERAIDTDRKIREHFWTKHYHKFNLKEMELRKRIFLLKRAFVEKEFDAQKHFLAFMTEMTMFEFIDYFYCEEKEFEEVVKMYLMRMDEREFVLDKFDKKYVSFLYIFYKFIEETEGRDALNLMDLYEFLNVFYEKAKVLLNESTDGIENELIVVQKLFKFLEFYDIFEDSLRNLIISIVKKFFNNLDKIGSDLLIEECVVLIDRVCYNEKELIFGALIQRTRETEFLITVSEKILKKGRNLSKCFTKAILKEIARKDVEKSKGILFNYLFYGNIVNREVVEAYKEMSLHNGEYDGLIDLVLKGIIDFQEIESIVTDKMNERDGMMMVYTSKLILCGKIEKDELLDQYLGILVNAIYTIKNDEIETFLNCFAFEYFRNNTEKLKSFACTFLDTDALLNSTAFIEQVLFWFANNVEKDADMLYCEFYYSIVEYMITNNESIECYKYLFKSLSMINVRKTWPEDQVKMIQTRMRDLLEILQKDAQEQFKEIYSRILEIFE